MRKTPISKQGYEDLVSELQTLELLRVDYLAELVRARELGDLSENAAYRVARQRLSRTDSRIRFLKKAIDWSQVVDHAPGICGLGSIVNLCLDGKQQTITLVGHHEADPLKSKYSINSPLGRVIYGRGVGYRGSMITPRGEISIEVMSIA